MHQFAAGKDFNLEAAFGDRLESVRQALRGSAQTREILGPGGDHHELFRFFDDGWRSRFFWLDLLLRFSFATNKRDAGDGGAGYNRSSSGFLQKFAAFHVSPLLCRIVVVKDDTDRNRLHEHYRSRKDSSCLTYPRKLWAQRRVEP